MAAETGILGLSVFLGILWQLFHTAIARIRTRDKTNNEEREMFAIYIGILCGLVAFLVHSFFDTNFYSLQLMIMFWVMVGWLVSLHKRLNNEGKHDIKEP